jgi:toxin-antitoxin system PIN domain toxin
VDGALLDVNALVALAWDSHVHHVAIRTWFDEHHRRGWATSAITESGFVRVSSNPRVLPHSIDVGAAIGVLARMRAAAGHRFLADGVSPTDPDVPRIVGHRQVTDALLLTTARRAGLRIVTFDRALMTLAGDRDVELLEG